MPFWLLLSDKMRLCLLLKYRRNRNFDYLLNKIISKCKEPLSMPALSLA